MKRAAAFFFTLVAAGSAFTLAGQRDARACGGCFHPPAQVASDITDERMLLSVSQKQTTLYDQIRYSGSPSSFAWVLPIKGTVDVGLSSDVLFASIDTLTQTTIPQPQVNCPAPPDECQSRGAFGGGASADGGAGAGPNDVTVTKAENVGPYASVQLHATDSSALETWLSDNGFMIPADVKPIIAQYVSEGFDFLAMKLLPNQGVQAMRPVRVTMPGASLSLPLRMAAIGTGATVGISIWVVADGRYEPQNFPFFHIDDKELAWDFQTSSSNYTTLRQSHGAALGGKGWEIESSIEINQNTISQYIYSGGSPFGGKGDPTQDYLPITTATSGDGGTDGGSVSESASQVRDDDIKALFAGINGSNVRITRMRSDISHAAMNVDFVLRASADQSELSNVRVVTELRNATCPVYDGCDVVGSAPPDQAAALSTGPAGKGCAASRNSNATDLKLAGILGILGLTIMRVHRNRARRIAGRRTPKPTAAKS